MGVHSPSDQAGSDQPDIHGRWSWGRWSWLRSAAGLLALFWGLLFFGVIDLLTFLQGEEFHETLMLSTGWGLLFLFLVAGPLLVLCVGRGGWAAAASLELVAVAVALVAASAMSGSPRFLLAAFGVAATAGLVTTLGATSARRAVRPWRWSPLPAAVLAIAVVPAVSYAWTAARNTGTTVTTDDTLGFDHWPAQAALPIAALLIAVVAVGHPRGWRLPTWSVAAAALWFSFVALAEPDLVGSITRPWAAALAVWSVLFVASTEVSGRRTVAHPTTAARLE